MLGNIGHKFDTTKNNTIFNWIRKSKASVNG